LRDSDSDSDACYPPVTAAIHDPDGALASAERSLKRAARKIRPMRVDTNAKTATVAAAVKLLGMWLTTCAASPSQFTPLLQSQRSTIPSIALPQDLVVMLAMTSGMTMASMHKALAAQ
jgi:hypothetical protein